MVEQVSHESASDEVMRLAVEASPSGMVMINSAGDIVLVNSSAESMFGYQREELMSQSLEMLVPQRYRDKHKGLRQGFSSQPKTRTMGEGQELYALRKNGEEFPVEIGLNPIATEQGMMILASVLDITERKRHESQLKAALREKEVMLAEIHHRVKNNLQIIDSLLAMQLDSVSDENARYLLSDSQNRIRSMAIIHQTLYQSNDFANVASGTVITTLVNNLAQSYGVNERRGLSIEVETDEIYMRLEDSIPLGLIVNELVSNSLKHGFPEQREGSIRVTFKKLGEGQVRLDVMDNGIGLPQAPARSDSLGLRLVESLSDQLEAELTIARRDPTCFSVQFCLIPMNSSSMNPSQGLS